MRNLLLMFTGKFAGDDSCYSVLIAREINNVFVILSIKKSICDKWNFGQIFCQCLY